MGTILGTIISMAEYEIFIPLFKRATQRGEGGYRAMVYNMDIFYSLNNAWASPVLLGATDVHVTAREKTTAL